MGRTHFYATNIEVLCQRTSRAFDEWRTKAFDAIVGAYNNKLAAYNNELAYAKSRLGIQILRPIAFESNWNLRRGA
jgi:hypothetical protein